MKTNTDQIILCSCGSTEHQMLISYFNDNEDKEVYVHIHLNHLSFWKRLILGIKYIFGYTSKYGHWDEMILNPDHVSQLKSVIKYLEDGK